MDFVQHLWFPSPLPPPSRSPSLSPKDGKFLQTVKAKKKTKNLFMSIAYIKYIKLVHPKRQNESLKKEGKPEKRTSVAFVLKEKEI